MGAVNLVSTILVVLLGIRVTAYVGIVRYVYLIIVATYFILQVLTQC